MSGFTVTIPMPPSVNALYSNRGQKGRYGRMKTKPYRAWIRNAGWEVWSQHPVRVTGPYRLTLKLSHMPANSDPSNRLKAVHDLLVSLGLLPSDTRKHDVDGRYVYAPELPKGTATVYVEQIGG